MSKHHEAPLTTLPEATLVELRRWGLSQTAPFVDPKVLHRCCEVLDRRGESWAASVLGRDISARSHAVRHLPALRMGEGHILVAADKAEDDAVIAALENLL